MGLLSPEFRILAVKRHVYEMASNFQPGSAAPTIANESTHEGKANDPSSFISKITEHPLAQRCNPSLTLENSGSVARDHLASERTFLSYMRTSLTIAGTGVGECISALLFMSY